MRVQQTSIRADRLPAFGCTPRDPPTTDFKRQFALTKLAEEEPAADKFNMSFLKAVRSSSFSLALSVLRITSTAFVFHPSVISEELNLARATSGYYTKNSLGMQKRLYFACLFKLCLLIFLKWRPKKHQIDGSLCCPVGTITSPSTK